jgi:hypothetical protein
LACISARKTIWKAPATTLPNTLRISYGNGSEIFVFRQYN